MSNYIKWKNKTKQINSPPQKKTPKNISPKRMKPSAIYPLVVLLLWRKWTKLNCQDEKEQLN